jgi:hypothetical protein
VTRWITFDCFGTLVDWHRGFDAILRPMAGAATRQCSPIGLACCQSSLMSNVAIASISAS